MTSPSAQLWTVRRAQEIERELLSRPLDDDRVAVGGVRLRGLPQAVARAIAVAQGRRDARLVDALTSLRDTYLRLADMRRQRSRRSHSGIAR